MTIIFNPNYILKPDEGRSLIMSALVGRDIFPYMQDSTSTYVHPIFAMILCFVDGRDYEDCISSASEYLQVTKQMVEEFISKLVDNPNFIAIKSNDGYSFFPPYTIISKCIAGRNQRFSPDSFIYNKIDLRYKRHLTPSTITLMVNNICKTDCIYCYQDKSKLHKCEIPLQRIKELIKEARRINVRTFDVIGGEFFIYKYWYEVLFELKQNGFDPYLSTKLPLTEETVKKLASLSVRDIQISIDSLIEENLIKSIKVWKGYVNNLKYSLSLLNKYGIKVMVHTVLSKFNNQVQDMMSIFDYIKHLDCIIEWKIVTAENSIQSRVPYEEYKIDSDSLCNIEEYLNKILINCGFNVVFPWKDKSVINTSLANRSFFERTFCSGNYNSIYILPDGDVTICEQLYWNEHFIIGNVVKNDIIDIWNSEKAKSLFYINQCDIPSDSKCSTCKEFVQCRSLKQVCYRDIIRKYGADKWYYPDVNCPY